jgi:acylphosphatase
MSRVRSIRVRISGQVQGVGFRAWTEQRATALNLSGWVRNTESGDVEALI